MKSLYKIGVLLLFINTIGCSTMFLNGEIKNNTYIAKNNMFTIMIPQENGSYEFKYMKVKEQYEQSHAYVSFGPAAFDQSIYRVEFTKKPTHINKTVTIEKAAPAAISPYKKQLLETYGTELIEIESKKLKINNNNAYYWKFTQNIPIGKHMSNSSTIFTHYAYVIDYNIGAGVIWVQIPKDSENRDPIPPLKFAHSLKIMPNKRL